jgi:hypothetical protein
MVRSFLNSRARSRPTASSSWLTARRFFVHLAQVAQVRAQVVQALELPRAVRRALAVQVRGPVVLVPRRVPVRVVPVRLPVAVAARVVPPAVAGWPWATTAKH